MTNKIVARPADRIKAVLSAESVKQQFANVLADNAPAFVASVLDLYVSDKYLQECDPNAVVMEALKAATLDLPINKQLGFAYIVPFRNKGVMVPTFIIGYKGLIQLALRTGQYKYLNAGTLYEGATVHRDVITGHVSISGAATSTKPIGHFAYLELMNGYSKVLYMTQAEVLAHGKRFSRSFDSEMSPWKTNFEEMAQKTVLRRLITKYGIMTIKMAAAVSADEPEENDEDKQPDAIDVPSVVSPEKPAAKAEQEPQPDF